MPKSPLLIDTKYRHIKYTDGIDGNVTCETLGFSSITSKSECYKAALNIDQLSGYTQYDEEPGCTNSVPNNCQAHTTESVKMVYFRNCAIHSAVQWTLDSTLQCNRAKQSESARTG